MTDPQKNDEQLDATVETTEEAIEATETTETLADERIEALEAQVAEAKDQALRAAAEAQNVKRRAEQDVEKAHKFALEKFAKELIPVVESLEKAIETVGDNDENAMLEGIKLTYKQLMDALARFQVVEINPVGEPFDPNFHEAISMVPNPDAEPNSVMDVFQKGYTLHGRVLRPAMVVVAKAP